MHLWMHLVVAYGNINLCSMKKNQFENINISIVLMQTERLKDSDGKYPVKLKLYY